MSTDKHSPLPWSIHPVAPEFWEVKAEIISENKALAMTRTEANARLIVRAVNSHQALVDALKNCLEIMGRNTPHVSQMTEYLKAKELLSSIQ